MEQKLIPRNNLDLSRGREMISLQRQFLEYVLQICSEVFRGVNKPRIVVEATTDVSMMNCMPLVFWPESGQVLSSLMSFVGYIKYSIALWPVY